MAGHLHDVVILAETAKRRLKIRTFCMPQLAMQRLTECNLQQCLFVFLQFSFFEENWRVDYSSNKRYVYEKDCASTIQTHMYKTCPN